MRRQDRGTVLARNGMRLQLTHTYSLATIESVGVMVVRAMVRSNL